MLRQAATSGRESRTDARRGWSAGGRCHAPRGSTVAVLVVHRAAHGIHLSQQNGEVGTEAQRNAFIHYRALFEELLEPAKDTDQVRDKQQEASA